MIDWVYAEKDSKTYQAMNIGRLNNMGYTAEVTLIPTDITGNTLVTDIQIGYARIHQQHTTKRPVYRSLYALEYLRDKFTLSVSHRIWQRLSANWSVRWQYRMNGYSPYTKIDGKVMWKSRKYSLFVKADNITAHRYYDLGDVLQPGLWIMAGGAVNINL